jgi:PhzF family phenazine biosynthesis protein
MSFDVSRARLLSQYQVDAFTSKAFCGNPAGVVLGMRSTESMQRIAMENNLAETSFIRPVLSSEEPNHVATYDLRW